MSETFLGANPPTAVAAIAQQIKGAQDPETSEMQALVESV